MTTLSRQLYQADPMLAVSFVPVPDEAVAAMAQEIMMDIRNASPVGMAARVAAVRAAKRRARRRRVLAALVAAGVVTVPTAAVAVVTGGMHSGSFGAANDTEDVPGEEWLYTDSPEIRDVVQRYANEIPLPDGASYEPLLAKYPRADRDGRELVQATGLAQEVQFYAVCAWYRDWNNGDPARQRADLPTIAAVPDWKYWRFATDDATGDNPGLDTLRKIVAETASGTGTTLRLYLRANC